ncbi:MAG: hypothetical protein ABSA75_00600 [Candidatus Bathyarchaeia archaeon]|jgi:hypothetical protein
MLNQIILLPRVITFIQMNHYVKRTADGLVHVQNTVMGQYGQHHVHTEEDFKAWVQENNISKANLIELKNTRDCTCGLKAGEVIDGYPPNKE